MKLVTSTLLAADAVARWKANYRDPDYGPIGGKTAGQITRELEALGPTPKVKDVNRIIGNDSWTTPPRCDDCGKSPTKVVRLGQEPDIGSNTAHICRSCLQKALDLIS